MNAEDFRTKKAEDFSTETPFCFAYVTGNLNGSLFRSNVVFLSKQKMEILCAILKEHTGSSLGVAYMTHGPATKPVLRVILDAIWDSFKSWVNAGKIVP